MKPVITPNAMDAAYCGSPRLQSDEIPNIYKDPIVRPVL